MAILYSEGSYTISVSALYGSTSLSGLELERISRELHMKIFISFSVFSQAGKISVALYTTSKKEGREPDTWHIILNIKKKEIIKK